MNTDRLKFRVFFNGDYSITPYCTIDMNGKVWLDTSIMRGDGLGDPDTDIIDITDKCTVEMSTGLKDKNGNVVYENDICQVKAPSGGYNTVLVVWDGAAWRFQCWSWVKLMCFWNSDEIEIIGNIHTQKDGE